MSPTIWTQPRLTAKIVQEHFTQHQCVYGTFPHESFQWLLKKNHYVLLYNNTEAKRKHKGESHSARETAQNWYDITILFRLPSGGYLCLLGELSLLLSSFLLDSLYLSECLFSLSAFSEPFLYESLESISLRLLSRDFDLSRLRRRGSFSLLLSLSLSAREFLPSSLCLRESGCRSSWSGACLWCCCSLCPLPRSGSPRCWAGGDSSSCPRRRESLWCLSDTLRSSLLPSCRRFSCLLLGRSSRGDRWFAALLDFFFSLFLSFFLPEAFLRLESEPVKGKKNFLSIWRNQT